MKWSASSEMNWSTRPEINWSVKSEITWSMLLKSPIKDLMKINVVDYNFKSNKNKMQETGFVAQDLYKVYPIAVTPGDADETAAVKDSWKVDYGKVTPLLVKSIQDQQAIINAQQAEINELKAAVKQLLEKK